jgi:hypothetical protein
MRQSVGRRFEGGVRGVAWLVCGLGLVMGIAGCSGAPGGQDVEYEMGNASPSTEAAAADSQAAPATGPSTGACTVPDTGCACDMPGEVIDCAGPKLHIGSYTSCAPGRRVCGSDGVWGPCIGKTMHWLDAGTD